MGGSLPLVGDMQEAGFDLQICGYGLSSVYHGLNEYCSLSDMQAAFKIFNEVENACPRSFRLFLQNSRSFFVCLFGCLLLSQQVITTINAQA